MVRTRGTLIVASCIAVVSLSTMLLAILLHRRAKLPRALELSEQIKTTPIITTLGATDRQQLHEKKSRWQEQQQQQPPSPGQGAGTKAMIGNTPTSLNAFSPATRNIDDTSAALSSATIHSNTSSDSPVSVSPKIPERKEISVSEEVKKAGESLKELIIAAVKDAKDSAGKTGKRLKEQTINIDSEDIHSLGDSLDAVVELFEETMTEIRKQRYDDQIKLLDSYKELLHSQIKLIKARSRLASKLKPGA